MKKKKFCAKNLNFGLLPKYIARLGSWAGRWARLLGVQALGRLWARAECAGARAWVRGRGRRCGCWALAGARGVRRRQQRAGCVGGSSALARSSGWRSSGRRRGRARARTGSCTAGRAGAQAAGRQARSRQGTAGVGARGARPWRGLGAGRAAWAGRGCALGALGHFWPGLTQYFPESHFLDIVREPGS